MPYLHQNLGYRNKGEIVEVFLENAAHVRLMDSANFTQYQAGRLYHYYGAYVTHTRWHHAIPDTGHWHVIMNPGGRGGRMGARVQVLPRVPSTVPQPTVAAAPNLCQGCPDIPLGSGVHEENSKYDVFVSHASEDKNELARPLVDALRDYGLSVWYDETVLTVGEHLRESIDRGLSHSRFVVAIVTNSFFNKPWPQYELEHLVIPDSNSEQILLPIWHEITGEEVNKYCPSLANIVAIKTENRNIEEVAAKIVARVRQSPIAKI